MDDQREQRPAPRPIQPGPEPAARRPVLIAYLWSNRDRFTEAALARAASDAGFAPEEITEAAADVARRRQDEMTARPVKARARRTVLAMYGITFLVFAVLFLRPNPTDRYFGGAGPIALVVLAFVMLVALAIGLAVIAGQHPSRERAEGALGVMLAVPVVLLVIVSGLCLVTGGWLIAPVGV